MASRWRVARGKGDNAYNPGASRARVIRKYIILGQFLSSTIRTVGTLYFTDRHRATPHLYRVNSHACQTARPPAPLGATRAANQCGDMATCGDAYRRKTPSCSAQAHIERRASAAARSNLRAALVTRHRSGTRLARQGTTRTHTGERPLSGQDQQPLGRCPSACRESRGRPVPIGDW